MTEKPRDDKSKKPPAPKADAKPRPAPGDVAGTKGVVIDLDEYRKRKGR